MDHAGVSGMLMLTSSDLKAVCMQDTTDVLLRRLCNWLHKKYKSLCTDIHMDSNGQY